ncbi:MAG: outer membrane protein transport protein [Acidobacteriota bacterium]
MSFQGLLHHRSSLRRVVLASSLGLLVTGSALGFTDEEIFRGLNLHPQIPGARALGMGGAFRGLADDATAAVTNPAGLAFLDRPEFFAEMRTTNPDSINVGGSGVYLDAGAEAFARGLTIFDDDTTTGPSYVGYVHPLTERWVMAFTRYERHRLDRELAASYFSTMHVLEDVPTGLEVEVLHTGGDLDMLVDNYMVSAAVAIHEQFSLGLSIGVSRIDVTSQMTNSFGQPVDTDGDGLDNTLLRALDYETRIDDEDTSFTGVFGLLWRPHPKIRVGAEYTFGPEFDIVQELRPEGARAGALRSELISQGVANTSGLFINNMKMPDSYGVGLSFGPFFEPRGGGGLVINADVVHVEYTDILDGFVGGLNNQLFGASAAGAIFEIEDEEQLHLGLAYSWTVGYNNRAHVRAGVYTEPDHSIVTGGRLTGVRHPVTGALVQAGLFSGIDDDDDVHFTLGGGFTIKRGFNSFSLDVAADFSDFGSQYVGSAFFKF